MFKEIFSQNKKILIPFIMAGVPNLDESFHLANAMIEEGAQILELGVPFSDPSADGEILQKAADLALKNQVTLVNVLELAQRLHQQHPLVPIVLFTYLNPLLSIGLENYVKLALKSGIAATLTVDLPLEEAEEYLALHRKYNLKTVFLASPTTRPERLVAIDQACDAFLYYVSRNGVTGERNAISSTLDQEVQKVRSLISSNMAIGFGISNAHQAKEISQKADAVVIGSAYMRIILEGMSTESRLEEVRKLTRECLKVMN